MTNTTIQAPYIKYNPFNNYQRELLSAGSSQLNNLFNTLAPVAPFLPSKLGHCVNLALAIIECSAKPSTKIIGRTLELVGDYIDPKMGLGINTANSLAANLLNFPSNKLENSARILSNVLTITTFFKLSKRDALIISIAQALLQASLNFYASYKISQKVKDSKWNLIPAASQFVFGTLQLHQAYEGCRTFQNLQKIVGQVFIIMRHADRERKGDESQILPSGIERSKEAAKAVQDLMQKNGKNDVRLLASDLIRSQQTAQAIGNALDNKNIEIDARIHERFDLSGMDRKERKQHPQYIEHKSMSAEKQFYHSEVPGRESKIEQYQRMEEATYDFLQRIEKDQLGISVSHTIAIKSFMKGLKLQGHDIPDAFLKATKYCEMLILRLSDQFMLEAVERKRIELPPAN